MLYLEKYSKYKSKYLDLKNQLGGAITCILQDVGSGYDVLIFDDNLPGDLQSSMKDEFKSMQIAWFSWQPTHGLGTINWTIKSDLYEQILTERMKKFISIGTNWSNNLVLYWNQEEVVQSTELNLYKNKYEILFRTMAINELYKNPKFQEWAKTNLKI